MKTLVERTRRLQRLYDRRAASYDWVGRRWDGGLVGRWRRALWERVPPGLVLEVGLGSGQSFPYYPSPGRTIVGLELSRGMLQRAHAQLPALSCAPQLLLGDTQLLPFGDGTFDAVVASLVFCCVPEPLQGLRELRRVCRAGGRVLLLEHGRAPGLLGLLLDALDPLVAWLAAGEHLCRRPEELALEAGLELLRVDSFFGGIMRLMEAMPPSPAAGEV